MKYLFVFTFLFSSFFATAQFNTENTTTLKMGAGYAKDFPRVNGPAIQAVCNLPINNFLEAGIGMKYASMAGYPRTSAIKEFTKAAAIDFEMYLLPVNTELNIFRIGLGYSFSFYDMKRSFPIYDKGTNSAPTWNVQSEKGRSRGMTLLAEYQYNYSETLALGIRTSLFKAYDQAFYFGPFVAVRL